MTFAQTLSIEHHVKPTSSSCHYRPRNISFIRKHIDITDFLKNVYALVTLRLNYAIVLLYRLPAKRPTFFAA